MPRLLNVTSLLLALAASALLAADAPWYAKGPTWPATMLASREAMMRQAAEREGESAFKPFVSRVLRGQEEPQRVEVDVRGVHTIWLIATYGPDDYSHDRAVWAEPVLIDKDGRQTPLTKLKPASVKVGWGKLLVNQKLAGGPLQIGKRTFKHGYFAHAPSALSFRLDGQYERLEAWCGIGIGAPRQGSSQFKVVEKPDQGSTLDVLWSLLRRDFPDARQEMAWEREDGIWGADWKAGNAAPLAARYAKASRRVKPLAAQAAKLAAATKDTAALAQVRDLYLRSRRVAVGMARAGNIRFEPVRLAIEDLIATFGDRYPKGPEYLKRLNALETTAHGALEKVATGKLDDAERIATLTEQFHALRQEALLANPLLDFERLLVVRRGARNLGLPANWQGNCSVGKTGYDNEIAVLSPVRPGGTLTTLYKPASRQAPPAPKPKGKKARKRRAASPGGGAFVGDVDLHWDADRMLFSSIGSGGRWRVFEARLERAADGAVAMAEPVELPLVNEPDVDNYDACYLPDGAIVFGSTAPFVGVPCVFGGSHVTMLYRLEPDRKTVRRLCFEQDHDWCPTVLHNGRILYARWEYTDTPHSQTRLLFHMNPDGTEQMEYLGSNSYWPNSFFYARPIPGHPTKVVSVISGHHGVRRMGELVVFDPSRGRREASGALQRIPGHGKPVEPIIRDQLVNASWPKFLHPWPLGEHHFLVSCKPTPQSHWGLYLVDTFDNRVLLHEEPGYAILEPVPLRRTPRPPAIPPKVDLGRADAVVYMADVYQGDGLKGVPRGTVRKLRVFTYHFSYHGRGGLIGVLGMDGPWDIKRLMGTVPVEADGSAMFRVPANVPIAIQPLDAEGKALQLMRSWMTAMPGEVLSCVGCHERQNTTPVTHRPVAASRAPSELQPWHGPTRGFSFHREVQPVLDRYCIRCHNGETRADGKTPPCLKGDKRITDFASRMPGSGGRRGGRFTISYVHLHRYVRRPGIESDYHMLEPLEFHADTTELVQMLRKGHQGVRLDPESWDRLITWVDLNTPFHSTWTEAGWDPGAQRQRRRELLERYASRDDDPEADATLPQAVLEAPKAPSLPSIANRKSEIANSPAWPFGPDEARKRQAAAGRVVKRTIDLGEGMKMELVLVPAGSFVMGDPDGCRDELPLTAVTIDKPFWMGTCEVSNEQFARFDPAHDSRFESKLSYQFGIHGYPCNQPAQPVVRVTWQHARDFCRWLSERVGERCGLPTEAQWEWACRAGSDKGFWWGGTDVDYSKLANLGDAKLRELASNPYTVDTPLAKPTKYDDWVPKDTRFNDGGLITVAVGSYQPNAWGLRDMHGNVCEWTRTAYRPYPYREGDGRNALSPSEPPPTTPTSGTVASPGRPLTPHASRITRLVVRGGSWRDRPRRCRAAFRLAYRPYQRVFNVGFRVVCETGKVKAVAAAR